jgi:uncharacterized tellurite resistance protein B-like protein
MTINLTKTERVAVTKVLLDIMGADGDVDIREFLYLNQLQNNFGITDSEIKEAMQLNALKCLADLKTLTHEERMSLVLMMSEMISADKEVHKKELEVFVIVCAALDVKLPK